MTHRSKGFTLIELLIVVAIIAILAAIAVPNFLEAQVRSKVSRVKEDMRSLAVALETYKVDNNIYPADGIAFSIFGMNPWLAEGDRRQAAGISRFPDPILYPLTTPVAYMTSIPGDSLPARSSVFNVTGKVTYFDYAAEVASIRGPFVEWGTDANGVSNAGKAGRAKYRWVLVSLGPDRRHSNGNAMLYGEEEVYKFKATGSDWSDTMDGALYDATNGTISNGDIVRAGP